MGINKDKIMRVKIPFELFIIGTEIEARAICHTYVKTGPLDCLQEHKGTFVVKYQLIKIPFQHT